MEEQLRKLLEENIKEMDKQKVVENGEKH